MPRLMHSGSTDQAGLARGLGLDKVTVLHVVRGLETRGWLTRQASVKDRRPERARTPSPFSETPADLRQSQVP